MEFLQSGRNYTAINTYSATAFHTSYFIDVLTSIAYMKDLRLLQYEAREKDNETDKMYLPIHGMKIHRVFFHPAPVVLPLIFAAAWAVLLCQHISTKAMPARPSQNSSQPVPAQ